MSLSEQVENILNKVRNNSNYSVTREAIHRRVTGLQMMRDGSLGGGTVTNTTLNVLFGDEVRDRNDIRSEQITSAFVVVSLPDLPDNVRMDDRFIIDNLVWNVIDMTIILDNTALVNISRSNEQV